MKTIPNRHWFCFTPSMNCEHRLKSVVLGALVLGLGAGTDAFAQDAPGKANRFRLSYRPGFNISASFNEVSPTPAGPAQAGVNHEYVDGFNRVDRSDNALGVTSYFGYQNQNQIRGDSVYMHGFASDSVKDVDDDPSHGFELSYNRQLGAKGKLLWGLEGAFNYTALSISDSSTQNMREITDRYAIPRDLEGNLITLPEAPYAGTFTGPSGNLPGNTVLSDLPHRSVQGISSASAHRTLESTIFGFRIGPYLEYPFNEKLSVSLIGGFAFACVDSSMDFRETWFDQYSGQTRARSGSDSKTDWLFGGYVGANIAYMLNPKLSVFAGAQYQNLGNFFQSVNGKQAKLDLKNAIFVTVGIGYSF